MQFRNLLTAHVAVVLMAAGVWGAWPGDFEQEPIRYSSGAVDDPVARLARRIEGGEASLEHDGRQGWLRSLLRELKVPVSSQTLVFSKTSFQAGLISPRTPRAIYFGDDVYVGWVQGADVLEISAVDPRQGAIFYTLRQEKGAGPKFERQTNSCLQCHDSSTLTGGVPGHIVRSVYADPAGLPILKEGTFKTNQRSPLKERWGGWYVTGRHGEQRHMGNLVSSSRDEVRGFDTAAGANVMDLSGRFDTSSYLSGHSDIVALMVLEHQTTMHNLITRASYGARVALHDEAEMNRALGRSAEHRSESTMGRIKSVAEPLLEYLLFSGEAELAEPIEGASGFAEEFAKLGPRDSAGRSLRELDLRTRMFRYPCSYLIYSEAFDGLPERLKEYIYQRLGEVLSGEDQSSKFAHLSAEDRRSIRQILMETKEGLKEMWVVRER